MMAPAPQPDALNLLRIILTNRQLQQTLRSPAATMGAVPRTVQLPVPAPSAPGQVRSAEIPLGAVMNAIAILAGQSMAELNETMREDEPEIPDYIVSDDGDFVVDPASSDDRAALVAHLFRLNDEAERSGWFAEMDGRPDEAPDEADAELDESDEWAEAAGFP